MPRCSATELLRCHFGTECRRPPPKLCYTLSSDCCPNYLTDKPRSMVTDLTAPCECTYCSSRNNPQKCPVLQEAVRGRSHSRCRGQNLSHTSKSRDFHRLRMYRANYAESAGARS